MDRKKVALGTNHAKPFMTGSIGGGGGAGIIGKGEGGREKKSVTTSVIVLSRREGRTKLGGGEVGI